MATATTPGNAAAAAAGDRSAPPAVLPVGYYLDNFQAVLDGVLEQHADLLAAPELAFLAEFRRAGLDARRLYARLVSRRGPWFRCDRLRYPEIECPRALDELVASGLAEIGGAGEVAARLRLLVRAELLALASELEVPAPSGGWNTLPRADLGSLVAQRIAALVWGAELGARIPIVRLLRLPELRVLRLLFFGNLAQDWTEFVLADLGILRFERVPALEAGDARRFPSRQVLDQHLELRALGEEVAAAADATSADPLPRLLSRIAAPDWHPSTRRLRDGILLPAARACERAQQWEIALTAYRAAERPPARERAIRVLRRLGREPEAAALLAALRAEPLDETERVFGERDGPRARRRRGSVAPLPHTTLEVARAGSAEASALAALADQGHAGFFAENWLWRSLFGLAFWDIVFAPIPGAFTHRFQYGPLDLHDGFRAAREEAIAARLEELRREPRCGPDLLARWREKFGIANRLVVFLRELEPRLGLALEHVSGADLAVVADRLSRDLRRYGHGFPDLFLVSPEGAWSLVEVKAPGDVLRPEQEGWLRYLHGAGLPVGILHLRWRTGATA